MVHFLYNTAMIILILAFLTGTRNSYRACRRCGSSRERKSESSEMNSVRSATTCSVAGSPSSRHRSMRDLHGATEKRKAHQPMR